MFRLRKLLGVAVVLVGQSCAEVATNPEPSADVTEQDNAHVIEPCPECEPPPGNNVPWPPFGTLGDALYQAPGDPNPGLPGLWLGTNVTPAACFADRNPSIADTDKDWLADHCELELARGFAPTWGMAYNEGCPGAEPVWAVKYFYSNQTVRLVFLPAYYDDCGGLSIGDHRGDSEIILVEVRFDHASQHWVLYRVFFSAHYHGTFQGVFSYDRSALLNANQVEYNGRRYATHPMVHVARRKHANYGSDSSCDDGSIDSCEAHAPYFRFPIDPSRNLGSRHVQLVNCISSYGVLAGTGRQECFWTREFDAGYPMPAAMTFCGWHHTTSPCAGGYHNWLWSDYFEKYESDPGPGPNPPDPAMFDPSIGGSSSVPAYQYGYWYVNWAGHSLSSCAWYVNGMFVSQGGCTFSFSFGGGPATHTLRASVTRSDGLTRDSPGFVVTVPGDGENPFYRVPAAASPERTQRARDARPQVRRPRGGK